MRATRLAIRDDGAGRGRLGWGPVGFGKIASTMSPSRQSSRDCSNAGLARHSFSAAATGGVGRTASTTAVARKSTTGVRVWAYAAVGRIDDAHRAVADTLAQYPDLTIEGYLSDPGWNDVERGKPMQAMRKAGFPACASADVLAKLAKPVHLPECTRPQPTG